jgi:FtsH-binding integral membrane protein
MHGGGRTGGRSGLDPHDEVAFREFRRAVWQFGGVGLVGGMCLGVFIAPYARRFVGVHSNVAVPLMCGALLSIFGSAVAANEHTHSLQYALFKRREAALQSREKNPVKSV